MSLGFFSDILIPKYALPQPAAFDTNDQLWWASMPSPALRFQAALSFSCEF